MTTYQILDCILDVILLYWVAVSAILISYMIFAFTERKVMEWDYLKLQRKTTAVTRFALLVAASDIKPQEAVYARHTDDESVCFSNL